MVAEVELVEQVAEDVHASAFGSDCRRFTIAALIGAVVAAIPFLWLLLDLWSSNPGLLRTAYSSGYAGNFYDLQARAILHGHLWLANGSTGYEAFVHGGRQYTYFGLFPSILRMPVLMATHGLDGRLTVVSTLLAWVTTGAFGILMMWRCRVMVRPTARVSTPEAISFGALTAALLGGSVLLYLGAEPYVFNEDLMWSIAFTLATMFALLGVLEQPSWRRVIVLGVMALGVNLSNLPMAYACVAAGLLGACWFAIGKAGDELRRWGLPVAAAVVAPFLVGCAINWAKFGILVGIPVSDQISYHVFGVAHINGGKYLGLRYLPGDIVAYLQPAGLHFGGTFPYITAPLAPAGQIGTRFVETSRTASLPASMPLLFLLACWGFVTSLVTGQHISGIRQVRLVLLPMVLPIGAILIYGWILNRFLVEFLPLLALGAAVGLIDIFRRLDARSARAGWITTGAIALLALFSVVANFGISATPFWTWSKPQLASYIDTQRSLGGTEPVLQGSRLPGFAPAGTIFIRGDCAGLYISDGESPVKVNAGENWLPVEMGQNEHLCRELAAEVTATS